MIDFLTHIIVHSRPHRELNNFELCQSNPSIVSYISTLMHIYYTSHIPSHAQTWHSLISRPRPALHHFQYSTGSDEKLPVLIRAHPVLSSLPSCLKCSSEGVIWMCRASFTNSSCPWPWSTSYCSLLPVDLVFFLSLSYIEVLVEQPNSNHHDEMTTV